MRPDYKNWVPKSLVVGFWSGTLAAAVCAVVFALIGFVGSFVWAVALFIVFAVVAVILGIVGAYMQIWHDAFSYTGKRQLSRRIIDKIAKKVSLPEGGKCLDVGCGSGALTIAVAKANPAASVVGADRWGKEYASFSKALCEDNAKAEGVQNVTFEKGDATELSYADETFDAVTSNYVYHNIPSKDRQAILLETLRTLKKGGVFYIHDLFTKGKYGDMDSFLNTLKKMGYEKVELIDTTDGTFMTEKEAKMLFLTGSALLMGKK
ncbi:MAG: class I SAM-dependent methyltransferase [Clostridia bacterium]|nr:class I SAM-dependent methyltransferase [Clostridia bacterium]